MFDNKSVLEDDDTLPKRSDPEDSGAVSPLEGADENEPTRPDTTPPPREHSEPPRD